MQCEFCNKEFKNLNYLKTHQKITKYCLKLQGKSVENFECRNCLKLFSSDKTLFQHLSRCKSKKVEDQKEKEKLLMSEKDKIIKELKTQIKELKNTNKYKDEQILKLESNVQQLQKSITEIASRPVYSSKTTVNNNNQQQVLNLNDNSRINSIIKEQIKAQDLCDGQKSLAKFIVQSILTDENGDLLYKCVDSSRQNFQFINEHGHPEKDIKATKLSNAIVKGGIKTTVFEEGDKLWMIDGKIDESRFRYFQDKILEIAQLESDHSKFTAEMVKLTT